MIIDQACIPWGQNNVDYNCTEILDVFAKINKQRSIMIIEQTLCGINKPLLCFKFCNK